MPVVKVLTREIGHRAIVCKRFHEGQRDAGDNRRTRQRQGHREEGAPRPHAQCPRRLEHAARPFEEGRADKQIDVRIKHEDKHQDGAGQGPDIGKPVVTVPPAERLAQRRLQRADKLQEIGIDIGQDIGRHGQRQDQRPLEEAAAGKIVHGGQPGGGDAEGSDADPDAEAQPERVQDVFRQHRLGQMRPRCAGPADKDVETDAGHRQSRQQRDDHGNGKKRGVFGGTHDSECEL